MIKKAIFLICIIMLTASSSYAVDISSPHAMLINPDTMEVLFERNADERVPMASITKVMTLTVVGDLLDNEQLALDDYVTVSHRAVGTEGATVSVVAGERLTVLDCIKAVALPSANDAAIVLAEGAAGSEKNFVALMNDKTEMLGLDDTQFANCHGLDAQGHYSTANDIALMSMVLLRNEAISPILAMKSAYIRNGKEKIYSTNELLDGYDGLVGIKTGTTSKAGNCLSTSATRNKITLIAVVLGCPTSKQRFEEAEKLLDYGFGLYDKKITDDWFMKLMVYRGQFVPLVNAQHRYR